MDLNYLHHRQQVSVFMSDNAACERSAISWDASKAPTVGQRLSYDKGTSDNQPCAVNLARI